MTADEPTLTEAEREFFVANLRQNLGYKVSPIIAETMCGHVERILADRLAQVTAAKERAEAQVERVRTLHRQALGAEDFCEEDGFVWPCPTARALAEPTDADSARRSLEGNA